MLPVDIDRLCLQWSRNQKRVQPAARIDLRKQILQRTKESLKNPQREKIKIIEFDKQDPYVRQH
jgi:hypothetical protein